MAQERFHINEFSALKKELLKFYRQEILSRLGAKFLVWFNTALFLGWFFMLIELYCYMTPSTKWFFVSIYLLFICAGIFYMLYFYWKKTYQAEQKKFSEASGQLENYFLALKDKLRNVLQLSTIGEESLFSSDLLKSAILERSIFALKFPFAEAIRRDKFRSLAYIFLFAISLLILSFAFKGKEFSRAFSRLIHPSVFYSPPAPFDFILMNKNLYVEAGKDYELRLKLAGESVPENVDLLIGGQAVAMKKTDTLFTYTLSALNKSIDFQFKAGIFYSPSYSIKALFPPLLNRFILDLQVPAYTGDSSYTLHSVQDIRVPEGTKFFWKMSVQNTDTFFLNKDSSTRFFIPDNDKISFKSVELNSHNYELSFSNQYFRHRNKLQFTVDVKKDDFPVIDLLDYIDSLNYFQHYFYIQISDDYGFSSLSFQTKEKKGHWKSTALAINKHQGNQKVYYSTDFSVFAADEINYRFVVADNDAVNGAKRAYSPIFSFKKPSLEDFAEADNKSSEQINSGAEDAASLMQEIRQQMKDLYKQNMTENLSDWDKKEKVRQIRQKQEELLKMIENLKEKLRNKGDLEKYLNQNKKLLEKQKQLQELFDKLMDDELKKLMQELNKLEQNFNDKKYDNLQKQFDNKLEDMQKELDRNLELLKKYEVERNLETGADEMKKLAQKEKNTADSLRAMKSDTAALSKKIQDLKKKFDFQKKNFEQTYKKNKDLKEPMKLDNLKKDFQKLDSMMSKQEQMQQQGMSNRKMKKQMQQNARKMQELSQKMQNSLQQQQYMQMKMSLEALRQILDNVLEFSFEQEKLMNRFKQISIDNPEYLTNIQKQKQLEEDFKVIQDSLYSLTEDIPQIATGIKQDIAKVRKYSQKSVDFFENRRVNSGVASQQFVMTSANNLALFLSESLESLKKMQKNASGSGKGKPKPSSGKPSFMQLKKQQQSLKQQMQQMIKDMKSGKMKRGTKPFSKRLAEILAQQEILQQMLEKMQLNGKLSPKADKYLKEIKQLMNKNEIDIVNKRISPELLNRQKKILTRLLESEKAEQERDKDKKRESKTTEDLHHRKVNFDWDKINKNIFKNQIQEKNLDLQPFYKKIFDNYQKEH